MRRREFITLLGSTAAACPLAARAQQSAVPVIGFLRSTSAAGSAHLVTAFEEGLKEAGFINGQNVAIDYRWGNDQSDRLAGLAADLIRRQVAVIIGNTLATHSIMAATKTIPVVFVVSSDPVRTSLVGSLSSPLTRAVTSPLGAFQGRKFSTISSTIPSIRIPSGGVSVLALLLAERFFFLAMTTATPHFEPDGVEGRI